MKKLRWSSPLVWGLLPMLALIGLVGSAFDSQVKDVNSANLSANEEKASCYTELVPFQTVREDTLTLDRGTEQTSVEGQHGEREICTKGSEEVSREVTKQPVNQIVLVGTKETPPVLSGSSGDGYINSQGNYVPSPSYDYNSGATARCNDGTYSYSQSRRGTCSHHGGVAEWY